ncbi:flagellar biosynthesis protein [Anaerovirgula multivorans]|uniref:Flagellar biosynthesis protein n=1 Tax=Anaerovirgula multivorans TaxID=312168 RepID=A0A239EV18_9FIRM|nr:EscU/YscU/HrcU family type III secretion system export apparatus switch protein [Anaerovirgula multivorans]SNS48118.1 flagellar biosynthesis protein [Anaerovirgula multivorans]
MEEERQEKKAVALRYNMEEDAVPKVIAAGKGAVAENILKAAEENEIVIHQNDKLVKELIQFKVGTEIPQELYEVVAQILVYVEAMDKEKSLKLKDI